MKHSLVIILAISILFAGCTKKINPFLIEKHNIGALTDSTKVYELKTIFKADSVAKIESKFGENTINIYDKQGNNLLILTPKKNDSTATIKTVQVIDNRFKTIKNISISSSFKDIEQAYEITGVNTLINSVVLNINELNASFSIDKKELPGNIRYNNTLKIEKTHIPDNAKIKYFFIYW